MEDEPFICQLAFCVTDMLADVHLFLRGLGYRSMGGRYLAGEPLKTLQELDDPVCLLWWLSGAQPFFQLEFFEYLGERGQSPPPPRRAAGYAAAIFAVPSLDDTAAALELAGAVLETRRSPGGPRSLSVRAPSGATLEFVEDTAVTLPARLRGIRATVSNIERASAFFVDVLGFVPLDRAPDPNGPDTGRQSPGARLRAGDVVLHLELVPESDARTDLGHPALDEPGIQNFAVGFTDKSRFIALHERLRAGGFWTSNPPDLQRPISAVDFFYSRGPDGLSVEVLYCPAAMRAALGFAS